MPALEVGFSWGGTCGKDQVWTRWRSRTGAAGADGVRVGWLRGVFKCKVTPEYNSKDSGFRTGL